MTLLERWRHNPFYVLGLTPDTTRPEIERSAQRLLAELAIGRETAKYYTTPLGAVARTEQAVREALAELRDPARRAAHEVWARTEVSVTPTPSFPPFPWSAALRCLGLGSEKQG
jgi:hypothetical protein